MARLALALLVLGTCSCGGRPGIRDVAGDAGPRLFSCRGTAQMATNDRLIDVTVEAEPLPPDEGFGAVMTFSPPDGSMKVVLVWHVPPQPLPLEVHWPGDNVALLLGLGCNPHEWCPANDLIYAMHLEDTGTTATISVTGEADRLEMSVCLDAAAPAGAPPTVKLWAPSVSVAAPR